MTDTWHIAVAKGSRRIIGGRMQFMAEHFLRLAGYEVFAPTAAFKVWIRNKPKLRDRPQLDRYLFVRGAQPWTIPYVEGVQCLVLDADGLPAEVPESDLQRFRPKPLEKPTLRVYLKGDRVRVTSGPLEGATLRVQCHKPHQRIVTLDGPNGSVRLSDGLVEAIE